MGSERTQRERQELHDVERAGMVLRVVAIVCLAVMRAIDDPALDQELAPGVIAVAAQQRVVKIEDGQAHGRRQQRRFREVAGAAYCFTGNAERSQNRTLASSLALAR